MDLKRTMDVQRTQSDPEDPHPRLDESSFSLRFEVGEETIDSEDRSELGRYATRVRSDTSSRFAFEQNGRRQLTCIVERQAPSAIHASSSFHQA
jgi:hypothetical protein